MKTKLPDWFVKKGLIDTWTGPMTKDDMKEEIEYHKKEGRSCKYLEEMIKRPVDYYAAEDVERLFEELCK